MSIIFKPFSDIYSAYKAMQSVNESNEVSFDHIPTKDEINPLTEANFPVTDNWAYKWYRYFNLHYFQGKLPSIKIHCYNFTKDPKTLGFAEYGRRHGEVYPIGIEINTLYNVSEEQVMDTLLHEMIHIYDYAEFPEHYNMQNYKAHGAWFHNECNRINAYGWDIWTKDKTGAKLSSTYYDDKNKKYIDKGIYPLMGIVITKDGNWYYTKTDTKDLQNSINACRIHAKASRVSLDKILYFKVQGCSFATKKNINYFWGNEYTKTHPYTDIIETKLSKNEFESGEPFYVAEINDSAQSRYDMELENYERNRAKILKGFSNAIASLLYENMRYYEGDLYDDDTIMEVAESGDVCNVHGVKNMQGKSLGICVTRYNTSSCASISTESVINLGIGDIANTSEFQALLHKVNEAYDEIDDDITRDVERTSYGYYDNGYKRIAVKVILSYMKYFVEFDDVVKMAEEKYYTELKQYTKEYNERKKTVNEDFDEDNIDTRYQLDDEYAKHIYDNTLSEGYNAKITKSNDGVITVSIE